MRSFQSLELGREGFSLLEVLVALTVFAIGAGGMLAALGHQLRNVSYLEDQAFAVRIASREMNALRQSEEFVEIDEEGEEGRFVWLARMHAEDLSDWPQLDALDGDPARMEVLVQWSDTEEGELTHNVRLEGFEVF